MGTSTDPEEELLGSRVDNRHASEFSAHIQGSKNLTALSKINIPGSRHRDMANRSRVLGGEPDTARLPGSKTPRDRSANQSPISTVDSKRLQ